MMPPRGTAIDVPQWWLDDLRLEMERQKVRKVDIAERLTPERLRGEVRARAVRAMQVKLTRFIDGVGDDEDPIRTIEMVEALCKVLGLRPLVFIAATRSQSSALDLAMSDPESLEHRLRAGALALALESGEYRLDEALVARQSPDVASSNEPKQLGGHGDGEQRGDERRGSGGRDSRTKAARVLRR